MNRSEQINEIAEAQSKAQLEMQNPHFDLSNDHFHSKYASLAAVRDAVVPVLAKHGLSLVQSPVTGDKTAGCSWLLMHKSGQWLSGEVCLPVDRWSAHGIGSAITYARRYSMQAIAGVAGEADDDGNAAVESNPKKQTHAEKFGRKEKAAAVAKEKSDFAETERQMGEAFDGPRYVPDAAESAKDTGEPSRFATARSAIEFAPTLETLEKYFKVAGERRAEGVFTDDQYAQLAEVARARQAYLEKAMQPA